jgi:hypothetical protein
VFDFCSAPSHSGISVRYCYRLEVNKAKHETSINIRKYFTDSGIDLVAGQGFKDHKSRANSFLFQAKLISDGDET